MARVGGSYESVVRGVSEQSPQDRRSGQMWEQVNMISDPVRGLVRRHGSQYQNSFRLGDDIPDRYALNQDATKYKSQAYYCGGRELEIIYRNDPSALGLPPLICYDKTNMKFLSVRGEGIIWDYLNNYGISSMVNIGKFMFIGAKKYPGDWTINDHREFKDTSAKLGCIWIRQGNYSRTYKIVCTKVDGTLFTVEYKTPGSSYEGVLSTSDIPVPNLDMNPGETDPNKISNALAKFNKEMAEYNKKVSDRTNQYNTAVTQWISTSSAAIQPENIAERLKELMVAQVGAHCYRTGQFVYFSEAANVKAASVEDGGDDTYMRAVVSVVDNPEKLTPQHYIGKVIKIAPKKQNAKDGYYLMAHSKTGLTAGAFGEVQWRETAGQASVINMMFAIGYATLSTLYIGSSPTSLDTLMGEPGFTPPFKPSTVGDTVSVPLPNFLGKQIDYLGVFQDRLLVGAGATIYASRPGDYFNMFRQSVLTLEDNDPVEMYALGSEDDVIRWDTSFDRNHVLFGRKFQYIIPGRTMMSPKNPSIQVMSAHEDAIEAQPKNSGNFVFFAKDNDVQGSLHQIQMGSTSDSSEAYECSQQLDKFIQGKPCEILCQTAPFNILLRSKNNHNGIYVYTYLDSMQGSERLFDSWARWEWDAELGASCGMAKWKGDTLIFTLRSGESGLWVVCDRFTFNTELSDRPYLDSHRSATIMESAPLWWTPKLSENASVAYGISHEYYMLGSAWDMVSENMPWWEADKAHLWVGIDYNAYLTPTSPYIRDKNDKAIINGRLTLGKLTVSVADTAGLIASVETPDRITPVTAFDGRLLTRKDNKVGRTPIVTTTVSIPVYKEIREFKCHIHALNWLPLTITGMEWMGQWFSSVRRV